MPFTCGRREFAQIFGPIDITRNSRQFEDYARQAGCLGRRQVRQKTVISKA